MNNADQLQKDDDKDKKTTPTSEETLFDDLQAVIAAIKNSAKDSIELVQAEWVLSLRAIWLTIVAIMFVVGLALTLWLALCAVGVYFAYTEGMPVGVIAGIFFSLQLLLAGWVMTRIKIFLNCIGFPRSLGLITEKKDHSNDQQQDLS